MSSDNCSAVSEEPVSGHMVCRFTPRSLICRPLRRSCPFALTDRKRRPKRTVIASRGGLAVALLLATRLAPRRRSGACPANSLTVSVWSCGVRVLHNFGIGTRSLLMRATARSELRGSWALCNGRSMTCALVEASASKANDSMADRRLRSRMPLKTTLTLTELRSAFGVTSTRRIASDGRRQLNGSS